MLSSFTKAISRAGFLVAASAVAWVSHAELKSIDDTSMSDISGQGGVYLTGEFSINKDGGPLWTNGTRDYYSLDGSGNLVVDNSLNPDNPGSPDACEGGICGLRIAVKLNENSDGWYILDDLSGGFSFEGLEISTETLTTSFSETTHSDAPIAGGGVEVLQIKLPGTVAFNKFKFTYSVANNGEFGVPLNGSTPFQQTDIFGVQIDGDLTLQGNLLLFPVD